MFKRSNQFKEIVFKLSKDDLIISESTSKGNQEKWRKNGYWIKKNYLGYESLAERVATLLMSCIKDFNYIEYNGCKVEYKGEVSEAYCYSKDFLWEGESIITIGRFIKSLDRDLFDSLENLPAFEKAKKVIDFVKKNTSLDITNYLGRTIYLDSLILNEDRHLFNLAIIKTEGGYRECPVFDNGLSFLSDLFEYPKSRKLEDNIRDCRARPFSEDFSKQVSIFNSLGIKPLVIDFDRFYNRVDKLIILGSEEDYLERCLDVIDYTINRLEGLSWIRA